MKYIEEKNRFIALDENDGKVGQLLFRFVGDSVLVIDSIVVDLAQRGRGIAASLLDAAVEKARREEKKVLPICSYAQAVFKKNKAYQAIAEKLES